MVTFWQKLKQFFKERDNSPLLLGLIIIIGMAVNNWLLLSVHERSVQRRVEEWKQWYLWKKKKKEFIEEKVLSEIIEQIESEKEPNATCEPNRTIP